MSELKVEKGINPPDHKAKSKYPFAEMEVGDSLLDPDATVAEESKVRTSAITWGKSNNATFSAKKVEGGVRIWRKT